MISFTNGYVTLLLPGQTGITAKTLFVVLLCLIVVGISSGAGLNADQWNDQGVTLYENGSYDEALLAYEKATDLDPQYEPAWYNKGLVLFSLGRYESSVEAYSRAIDLNPDSGDSWFNLGLALEKTGNKTGSEDAFLRSSQLEGGQSPVTMESSMSGSETDTAVQESSALTDDASAYQDDEFDRLYEKNDKKITESLHQITTWITDRNWKDADAKSLSTSRYLVEYLNQIKALHLSDKYDDARDSYVFFLELLAKSTNEISEIASLYPVYFDDEHPYNYNKADNADYLKRLQSVITTISNAKDELDRFSEKYSR